MTFFVIFVFPPTPASLCFELTSKVSVYISGISERIAKWSSNANSIHIHLLLSGANKLAVMLREITMPPTDEDWFIPESSQQSFHPLQTGTLSYFTSRYFTRGLKVCPLVFYRAVSKSSELPQRHALKVIMGPRTVIIHTGGKLSRAVANSTHSM